MSDDEGKDKDEALSEEDLAEVAGGLEGPATNGFGEAGADGPLGEAVI